MKFIPHAGNRTWQQVIDDKWWINQRGALARMDAYLAAKSDRQAMVRMPTGTGKTAVIAALGQLLADKPRCLVVAPWENLVKQLRRELAQRFWAKVGEETSFTPKGCRVFTPSSFAAARKEVATSGVLLCTNQTLQALRKNDASFRKLRTWCELVLVDEGHREPAPRWAEAVRELESPTVLFTATPYRNDLQLFDVDPTFTYSFTFGEALNAKIVRNVSFIDGSWPLSGTNVATEFVGQLIKSVAATANQLGIDESAIRVIVRCEDAEQIKSVVPILVARGRTVVGIHETFSKSDGKHFAKEVPDPSIETAQFWVHQYKLLEGLDDPAFRLIAIFGRFTNARNLVQQVGRVIRNPGLQAGEMAFVLAHAKHGQKALWDRFIEYEKYVQERVTQGGSEISALEHFLAARTAAPRFYFLGDFRKHLHPEDVTDPRKVVRLRKSVLVRTACNGFSWKALVRGIQHELLTGDAGPFGVAYQNKSTFLQLFQISEQSDLVSEAYLETRLGYILAREIGDLVFFADSEGRSSKYLGSSTTAIAPEELQRLLPDQLSTIKEISLINGDFGNSTYLRRSLSTQSLELVPPTLSDYVHVCSTATGSVKLANGNAKDTRRRYLSFTRGRLAERTTPIVEYDEFAKWLDDMAAQLRDTALIGDDSLERFARPYQYTGSEEPSHILFDIGSEAIDATAMPATATTLRPDALWLVNSGLFRGEIEEQQFEATVQLSPQTGRFEIESAQLDAVTIDVPDGRRRVFTKYLNESQEFRILLGTSVVYAQGRFFTPNLRPWRGGGSRINIEKIVVGCVGLQRITSEKGGLTGWDALSVFGAITDKTKVFRDAGWVPEILVCNDVGAPEIADFFGLSEKAKKVVMIHAKKAKEGSKLSASSFHEVCSQAVRYLGFFNPSDTQTKLSEAKIAGKWAPDAAKYKERERLVWAPAGIDAKAISQKFTEAISDPTYGREVWLVMGNGLSQDRFVKAVAKKTPKPNEREMSYLLQSTWCAAASVGASLKVVCMP
jgi:Type III restriction enzyme, res subunit